MTLPGSTTRWIPRMLAIVAGVLVWLGQTAQADAVQVGRHHLQVNCQGQGSPTVILDAGLGGSSLEWVFVAERLRTVTRVCSFDRAGYGGSEMGPMPRTSSRIVNELFLLLTEAGIDGPLIIAGHSFGGYNAQLFARRYAYRTAGVVLIDASHPDQVERFRAPPLNLITAPSSRYGIVQFKDPAPPHAELPPRIKKLIRNVAGRWKTRRTLASEMLNFRDSGQQVKQEKPLTEIPLVVISRGRIEGQRNNKRELLEQRWLEMQSELAAASRHSAHLVAKKSGHHVHIEQPDVVSYGIGLLIKRFRADNAAKASVMNSNVGEILAPVQDVSWLRDTLVQDKSSAGLACNDVQVSGTVHP